MGLTKTQMVNRVKTLLGQDPTVDTEYVTTSEIEDWIDDSIDFLCLVGRVYERTDGTLNVLAGAVSGDAPLDCIEVMNVIDSNGEALTKIEPKEQGKLYNVSGSPTWWYEFGKMVFVSPAPTQDSTFTVHYWALAPKPGSNEEPAFPDEYHIQCVNYAMVKALEKYNRASDADRYLAQLSSVLSIDIAEIKSRMGVSQ